MTDSEAPAAAPPAAAPEASADDALIVRMRISAAGRRRLCDAGFLNPQDVDDSVAVGFAILDAASVYLARPRHAGAAEGRLDGAEVPMFQRLSQSQVGAGLGGFDDARDALRRAQGAA